MTKRAFGSVEEPLEATFGDVYNKHVSVHHMGGNLYRFDYLFIRFSKRMREFLPVRWFIIPNGERRAAACCYFFADDNNKPLDRVFLARCECDKSNRAEIETSRIYTLNQVNLYEDGFIPGNEPFNEDGGYLDPANAYEMLNSNGHSVSLLDFYAIASLFCDPGYSTWDGESEPEEVPCNKEDELKSAAETISKIATINTTEAVGIHAFYTNVANGLIDIAMGISTSYEIAPRRAHSCEKYKLIAPQESCNEFVKNGGTAVHFNDVLETVATLIRDRHVPEFATHNRIWFTVNTIVEEMRRTTAGTVNGRKYARDKEIVSAALWAASSSQVVGYQPNGDILNIKHFIDATYAKEVVVNNQTYRDVWGFSVDSKTLYDYARSIGQSYTYPLLKADKPLSLDEAATDRYLKDILNQIRNNLYRVNANGKTERKRQREFYVKRSWNTIFEEFSPVIQLDARQKRKVVERFNKVLSILADMDAHDELRAGMPLYIEAYSTRQRGKGKGGGAWDCLVIKGTSNFRAPSVDLITGRASEKKETKREGKDG